MKSFLPVIILLICFQGTGFSQDSSFSCLRIRELPPGGIDIGQGWKFHAGDDTAWANPSYDDRHWKQVNLSGNPGQYLDEFNNQGIGWFRNRLYVDSALRNYPLALVIEQLGASEIYVDHQLLISLGRVGAHGRPEANNPHGKPFLLQGNMAGDTISIAVRFASGHSYRPWLLGNVKPLTIRISPWTSALNSFQEALLRPRDSLGYSYISISLGLLFLFLYFFVPSEKINIFFAGFCFSAGISIVLNLKTIEGNLDMRAYAWNNLGIEFVSRLLGMLALSIVALASLKKVTRFQTWLISYVLTIDTLLLVYFGGMKFTEWANQAVHVLFTLELCRLTYLSIGRKEWLSSLVALSTVMINMNFFLNEWFAYHGFDRYVKMEGTLQFALFTIYVAYTYSQNSRALASQLEQNRKLGEEKQQILSKQKETLEIQVRERTEALSHSLQELKETQSQLIQSEKMASLGELTAGIAHEIQNPLNFVNNFSDLNAELIEEMKNELRSGNQAGAETISDDIRQNLEKISHHGRRAEAIVKGMLLHSRASTGQKEPTDINALADEYFRLSYHGLRAKDKLFNATMSQELDPAIGKIPVVAPDIGRVLLNLFNNAFYSVSEKKKKIGGDYEPTVKLSTKKLPGQVEIIVHDNGLGIPARHVDKIFQPFFTSKPAGHGTGLGLSMSYDIVTKEHGGQLSVHTEEGAYASFRILLPANG